MKALSTIGICALATVFLLTGIVFADLSAEQIIDKTLNRERGKNMTADVEMILKKGASEKMRKFSQLNLETPKGSKKLMRFSAPASFKNTAFLSWENKDRDDDQWLYLASRKSVRRIASSDKTSSFLGSDLSYEDLGEQQTSDRTHKLLGEEEFNGHPCWIVESTAKPGFETGYKTAKSWVGKKTFVTWKLETYDDKGKLIKTMIAKDAKLIDDVWTVTEMEMSAADGKTSTLLKVSNVKYGVKLSDNDFTKDALKKF